MCSLCQNGPTQFFSGSQVPLPEEKSNEALYSTPDQPNKEEPDSDSGSDTLEFPEVPKVSVRSSVNFDPAPETVMSAPSIPPPEDGFHSSSSSGGLEDIKPEHLEETLMVNKNEHHDLSGSMEKKQFVPFISPPISSESFSARQSDSPPALSKAKAKVDVDLNDVLVAAHAAAETAERAAAAARSAATLAQIRINELTKKSGENVTDSSSENPFYTENNVSQSGTAETGIFSEQKTVDSYNGHGTSDYELHSGPNVTPGSGSSKFTSFDTLKPDFDSSLPSDYVPEDKTSGHQPKRLPSMDEDPYFSYPNIFTSQNSDAGSHAQSDNTRSHHDL